MRSHVSPEMAFLRSPLRSKVEYDLKEIHYPVELGWSTWCHEDSEVSG
jgi:hypothetical protein